MGTVEEARKSASVKDIILIYLERYKLDEEVVDISSYCGPDKTVYEESCRSYEESFPRGRGRVRPR